MKKHDKATIQKIKWYCEETQKALYTSKILDDIDQEPPENLENKTTK